MAFLVGGANTLDSSYEIENSLRFNDGDSPDLDRAVVAGNRDIFTFSTWFKRSTLKSSGEQFLFAGSTDGSNNTEMKLQNDQITFITYDGSSNISYVRGSAKLRDLSAWYHVVYQIDTTQGTAGNRVKIWINGSQVTTLDQNTYQNQNTDTMMNANGGTHRIGADARTAANFFDGYIAETHYLDGTAYDASYFGETDDNGVWIPKKYTGGNYSNNGFYLEFKQTGTSANSSGMGADTSGEDHHYTPANLAAIDVTTDTPTNNFATLNPLSAQNANLSEGNVEGVRTTSGAVDVVSTIAPSNGKWYFEFKNTAAQNSAIGVVNLDLWASGTNIHDYDYAAAVLIESNANYNVAYGATGASSTTTLQNSTDLITEKYGLAVDIDNNDLYVSADGNWYGGSSFNQSDFSNATAVTTDLPSNVPLAFFARGSLSNTFYVNFGNPGGDDSISSGNADANGYGNFEFTVPTNYYALCTKNLAEYG